MAVCKGKSWREPGATLVGLHLGSSVCLVCWKEWTCAVRGKILFSLFSMGGRMGSLWVSCHRNGAVRFIRVQCSLWIPRFSFLSFHGVMYLGSEAL